MRLRGRRPPTTPRDTIEQDHEQWAARVIARYELLLRLIDLFPLPQAVNDAARRYAQTRLRKYQRRLADALIPLE